MKIKKILSLLCTMALTSSIAVMPATVKAATYSTLYANDFEDITIEDKCGSENTPLYEEWLLTGYNYDKSFPGGVADGALYRKCPWSTQEAGIKLSPNITKDITSDMMYEATITVPTHENYMSGAGVMRFALSGDGNSYYEIGSTGCKTDQLKYPNLCTGNDTKARFFIRKVEDGYQTDIVWEDDPAGFYRSSLSSSTDAAAVVYTRNKFRFEPYSVNIVVSTSYKGINYSVTAQKYDGSTNGVPYTWSGTYADTSLLGDGTGLAFLGYNGQKGIRVESVNVAKMEDPNAWIDAFNDRTTNPVSGPTGTAIDSNWQLVGQNGSSSFTGVIADGTLTRYVPWSTQTSGVKLSSAITDSIVTPNMEYKASMVIPLKANGTSDFSANGWEGMRFALSDDLLSYYEIGISGTKKDEAPIWSDAGVSPTDDHRARFYVRKVVDGVTEFINWENDEHGFYANSLNAEAPVYRRSRAVMQKQNANSYWFTVTVTTSYNQIDYSITGKLADMVSDVFTQDYTWSGTITDTTLLGNKTGLAFYATGGQLGVKVDNVSIKNLSGSDDPTPPPTPTYTYRVDNSDGTVTFKDSFNGYTEDNAHIGADNAVEAREYNKTIAENGDFKWKLSAENSISGAEAAFVNSDTRKLNTFYTFPTVLVNGNMINTYPDSYPINTVINMQLCNGGLSELKSIEVSANYIETCRNGIRIAVSADEKSYYEFGRGNWWDSTTDVNYGNPSTKLTGYPKRAPYVLKCVNGERTMLNYSTDSNLANLQSDSSKWTITINGDQITARLSDSNTYTYTFTDSDRLLNNFEYPLALWGNQKVWFDNVFVTGVYSDEITPLPDNYKIPSENPIKIAAVGDSNTAPFLYGIAYHTWPTKLGLLLGEDYVVENYGKPGYRLMSGHAVGSDNPSYIYSEEYANSLQSDADIVIIMLGTNDFGWSDTDAGLTKIANEQFYNDYSSLINSYKTALGDDTEFILAVPPIRGTAASPNYKVERYIRPLIKKLAADFGISYVDIADYMQDYSLLVDGLHFYPDAYYRFADCFYDAVQRTVNASIDDNTLTISATRSYSGNIILASYKDSKLNAVKLINQGFCPELSNTYDISDFDIDGCDEVKLMLISDFTTLEPYIKTIKLN